MGFKLLYLLARIRGKFPKIHEYDIYANGITELETRKIYEQTGWKPHRVTNEGVGFILPH